MVNKQDIVVGIQTVSGYYKLQPDSNYTVEEVSNAILDCNALWFKGEGGVYRFMFNDPRHIVGYRLKEKARSYD